MYSDHMKSLLGINFLLETNNELIETTHIQININKKDNEDEFYPKLVKLKTPATLQCCPWMWS